MTDKLIVLSTCPSIDEANRLARGLVEERLAACVNLIPGARSVYRWQGAIEESDEVLLIIKTRRDLLDKLGKRLSQLHTYEVPEAIAIPILDGLPAYLDWLDRELKSETREVEP
ncbi:MAG: divalent-cation tolerance protein CutA [Acidobacteria bacterium]|nr:divalent-cation tolerance protein CutA [Acidobacteriota bacterium]